MSSHPGDERHLGLITGLYDHLRDLHQFDGDPLSMDEAEREHRRLHAEAEQDYQFGHIHWGAQGPELVIRRDGGQGTLQIPLSQSDLKRMVFGAIQHIEVRE